MGDQPSSLPEIDRLIQIMERLRGPEGCPWDREQSPETLRPYVIEEAYEVVDAIDRGVEQDLVEELGDLLLQVVFHAQIATEAGRFTFEDVARSISDKLIRRHPHVFGDDRADTSGDVLRRWEEIKDTEKPETLPETGLFDRIPITLPALLKAKEIQKKASKVGFDWPDQAPVERCVVREWEELKEAMNAEDAEAVQHEFGDVLFSLVNLSRFIQCDPEESLRQAASRFRGRMDWMHETVRADGRSLNDCSPEELERLWSQAKQNLTAEAGGL